MNDSTIRFPMRRVRSGRRYLREIDCTGLSGAPACAARSINLAVRYRDEQQPAYLQPARLQLVVRIARLGMRTQALWARVFAGHIQPTDSRITVAQAERTRLVRAYCKR